MAESPGEIIVEIHQELKVTNAPGEARMALELLANHRLPHGVFVHNGEIHLGTDPKNTVTYQVTGWDSQAKALVLRRVA